MTISALLFLLAKVTALLSAALLCLLAMRRASAAMRHLVCAAALAASLLVPVMPKISPASIPVQMPAGVRFEATATATPTTHWAPSTILLGLWLAGTMMLLARTAAGYVRLASLLRGAEYSGVAGEVRIVSADVGVPFVSGLLRPLIALPVTWPDEFREAAVRHELAHVRRKDLWTELLARVTCAVYWFHPVVWLTAARLRYEREAACDDAVLYSGFDAPSYAEALVAAARRAVNSPLLGCSMITTTTLKSRTARLLDSTLPRMATTNALIRTAIACAAVFATIGIIIPIRAQSPAAAAPAAMAQNSAPAAPAAAPAPVSEAKPAAAPRPAAPAPQAANNPSGDVYTVGGEVSPPRVLSKVDPTYPEDLKDQKVSGSVLLDLVIGADGLARDITVVETPADGLNQAAIAAIQQWTFAPGLLNGEPVAVKAKIEVNFKLL